MGRCSGFSVPIPLGLERGDTAHRFGAGAAPRGDVRPAAGVSRFPPPGESRRLRGARGRHRYSRESRAVVDSGGELDTSSVHAGRCRGASRHGLPTGPGAGASGPGADSASDHVHAAGAASTSALSESLPRLAWRRGERDYRRERSSLIPIPPPAWQTIPQTPRCSGSETPVRRDSCESPVRRSPPRHR
jgi:hypothetical protein